MAFGGFSSNSKYWANKLSLKHLKIQKYANISLSYNNLNLVSN